MIEWIGQGTARGLLVLSLAIIPPALQAAPVKSPVNGHFYEVIASPDISWDDANTAASGLSYNGVQGHLATLTSQAENDFVESLRQPKLGDFSAGKAEAWIGGLQATCTPEPGCGWSWVNGEGPIPTPQFPGTSYSNWFGGEPNDSGGEAHLTLGRYTNGEWNDSSVANNAIGGYIVEYDVPLAAPQDANDCTTTAGGCNPSGVQQVILPPSLILGPTDTLTQTLVERAPGKIDIIDPRVDFNGNCTLAANGLGGTANPRQSLDVFGNGALILPPWLCGSPRFAVVRSDASFTVPKDVIRSEQFPEVIFQEFYPCQGNSGDTDLQRRGVFAWQPDNRSQVPEQSALELTNGCGSSRGATPSASWFVLNLHIDCGIPFGSDDFEVRQCFIDLTNAKYEALGQVLMNAKKRLTEIKFGALQSQFSSSWSGFQEGDYPKAQERLAEFISRVKMAAFNEPGFNHQGHLLARAENIQLMIGKVSP